MNEIFLTLTDDKLPPAGWGFPYTPTPRYLDHPEPYKRLRKLLIPLDGPWEFPNLVRWHFVNLRAHPEVWRSFASGGESYDPSLVYMPPIKLQEGRVAASPKTITLTCGHRHNGLLDAWHGTIAGSCPGTLALTLGSKTWTARTKLQDGLVAFDWPVELSIRASLLLPDPSSFATQIRLALPVDAKWMAGEILSDQTALDFLGSRGLLDSFLSSPFPEERIALCWLALHQSALSRLAV